MSYSYAKQDGTKVGEIEGEPVFFYRDLFYVSIDGAEFSAKSMEQLRSKVNKIDKVPVKVIKFYVGVYGGYEEELQILKAIAYSKTMVYEVDEEGKKERISRDNLYVHTPELEEKFKGLLQEAKNLRKKIETTLHEAKHFP